MGGGGDCVTGRLGGSGLGVGLGGRVGFALGEWAKIDPLICEDPGTMGGGRLE